MPWYEKIKNLSPLRSSDRRKLADQLISDYHVAVPQPAASPQPPVDGGDYVGDGNHESSLYTAPNALTAIRSNLLPENCSSVRFSTQSGSDSKPLSGTLYVGSFEPTEEHRVLWFQVPGPSDHELRLYPTVYTLWRNPSLVALLHTQRAVVEKLQTGADLMTPGLAGGPPFPEKTRKGSIVAVASIEKPTVPKVIGVCEIDISALGRVAGAKGRAVKSVHWEGDELWAWSNNNSGGRDAPDMIEAVEMAMGNSMKGLIMHEDAGDGHDRDDGGVSLQPLSLAQSDAADTPNSSQRAEVPIREVDQYFHLAFLYAIYNARKRPGSTPPHYGIEFPIGPSVLISHLIQPFLPPSSVLPESQSTIKKTSWKNAKKFIKYLDKEELVKSKDRNGGETVIIDIDFDDRRVVDFTPYPLPAAKDKESGRAGGDGGRGSTAPHGSDGTETNKKDRTLNLQVLFRTSPKLVPDLLPSKTDFYTPQDISSAIRDYIDQRPELTKPSSVSSRRFVKIDSFIANDVLGANPSPSVQASDTKVLAAGEIARDALQKRILEDDRLCQPYWVMLEGKQKWPSQPGYVSQQASTSPSSNLPKPKPGPPPKICIQIERRTGTKTVTKISNLEPFSLNAEVLAGSLQKKCASSTSIGQRVGGKPGQMEVMVQGDQQGIIKDEVERWGVEGRWVEIVDKVNKGKGKKGGGGGK